MTDRSAPGSVFNWKQLLIPVLTCFGFALYARSANPDRIQWIVLTAALPLFAWALITRVHAVVYLLFFITPLSVPHKIGDGFVFGFPSEAMIAILVAYLVTLSLIKPFFSRELFRHPLVILLLAEVAWMLVCSITSGDPVISLKRVFVRSLFIYLFLLFGTHLLLKNHARYHWLFLLYGVGLIWPVIHSYRFHSDFGFSSEAAYMMSVPFFTDHTIYGACIVFILPMLLIISFSNDTLKMRSSFHFFVILLTVFLIAAEVLSFSRAAWVSGLVASVLGILLVMRVRLISIILFLLLAGGMTWWYSDEIYHTISKNDSISTKGDFGDHLLSVSNVQSDASNTERINRWLCAWRMAEEKPFVGFGPGMYQFEYGRFQERGHMTRISTFSGNKGHAHSEYFTQLSETGFPGFILFLVIVFSVIGYGMKVIYRETERRSQLLLYGAVLGLATFYVHGIFNAFLDTDKMAVLVFGSIAVIVAADIRQGRKLGDGSRE